MGLENLDIKGWRVEPFQSTFQKFSPNQRGLSYKYPLQSRWFSFPDPYYSWLGPETVIKELDTKLPINLYDKAGQVEIPGEGFTMKGVKSAADLAKEQEILRDWMPGERHKLDIVERFKTEATKKEWDKYIKDFWKKHPEAGRYGVKNPVTDYQNWLEAQNKLKELRIPMTEFEADARYNISRGRPPASVMTPPLDITNQAKVNLLKSFQQNFMKHRYDPDLMKKNIYSPKTRWEQIKRIPHKAADIFQRYRAGQPIKTGIPWSKIGMGILNNPLTRTIGGLGNVALGGQALLDVYTGSEHTGNMAGSFNKMLGVPLDRQGNVIQDTGVYRNLQKAAQRDILNPNEMRGVTSFDTTKYDPHTMNAGGIASLVV
jgi:hypothetical protein